MNTISAEATLNTEANATVREEHLLASGIWRGDGWGINFAPGSCVACPGSRLYLRGVSGGGGGGGSNKGRSTIGGFAWFYGIEISKHAEGKQGGNITVIGPTTGKLQHEGSMSHTTQIMCYTAVDVGDFWVTTPPEV